jgi:FHA domain
MSQDNKTTGSFLSELKRRRVTRTCIIYIVLCWGGLQLADMVVPALGYDADKASLYLLYGAVLGFPVIFALAWFFQFTSHGIVRTGTFVERRMLSNISPINERRHPDAATHLSKGEGSAEYHWILSAETGPLSGLNFGVNESLVLGRALECDIAIVSSHVARQHARLELQDGQLYVEDLGSSNGTVVNGKKVAGRRALQHDDELRFHDIIFRVTESVSRSHGEKKVADQTSFVRALDIGDAADSSKA